MYFYFNSVVCLVFAFSLFLFNFSILLLSLKVLKRKLFTIHYPFPPPFPSYYGILLFLINKHFLLTFNSYLPDALEVLTITSITVMNCIDGRFVFILLCFCLFLIFIATILSFIQFLFVFLFFISFFLIISCLSFSYFLFLLLFPNFSFSP